MSSQWFLTLVVAISTSGLDLLASETAPKSVDLKEPTYQSAQPLYCKLLFDKKFFDGQYDLSIWMVIDGDRLYIDKNANRDLTEPSEKLQRKSDTGHEIQFAHPNLRERFRDVTIRWRDAEEPSTTLALSLLLDGRFVLGSLQDRADLSKSPEKAPVILVSDKLRLFAFQPKAYLWTGNNARTVLSLSGVALGTKSSTGHYAFVAPDSLPKEVHPVAEIRYPPEKPDDEPRTQVVDIDRRGMNYFIGGATVPPGTPAGQVHITLKMKNWKIEKVKPTEVTARLPEFKNLPVINPKK